MTLAEDLSRRGAPAVSPAPPAALDFSAHLHRCALPDGFFPALGSRFMRAYHESFHASPHAVALTAWQDGRPVGFLVGTLANGAHYRWVVRHRGVRLGWLGARALLARPPLARLFLRTRAGRYARGLLRLAHRRGAASVLRLRRGAPAGPRAGRSGRTAPGDAQPQPGRADRVAVLSHVAVLDEARGGGAGAALVEAFSAAAARAGAVEAHLVTAADAERTHAFYRRCGWRKRDDREDHDGRMMSTFVRRIG